MSTVELYWGPGCSSCLRVKEFLTKHDVAFEAVNIIGSADGTGDGMARMRARGFDMAPVVCLGDRCVSGVDIPAVAALLGIDHTPHPVLPPDRLYPKMVAVLDALVRYARQIPYERLTHRSPDRDRTFRELLLHAMDAPWAFVLGYETGREQWRHPAMTEAKTPTMTGEEIAAYGLRVREVLTTWWETAGRFDELDRVIESYWGAQSLLDCMERETWHSAQHARQVLMFLDQLGIEPDGRLTGDDLAGLPLPDHVWS
jgi:glutaredoxin